jgi:hypothetical protein
MQVLHVAPPLHCFLDLGHIIYDEGHFCFPASALMEKQD